MTAADRRAALLLVVIAVQLVQAIPIPSRVRRSDFETDYAKEELAAWVEALGRWGIETPPAQLAETFFTVGSVAAEARRTLVAPLRPVYRLSGTGQQWGLFTYPDVYPHQLEVAARAGAGPWTILYRGNDPEHAWQKPVLSYRRLRGVYDGNATKPGVSWTTFTRWVARRVFAEFPEYQEVRVRLLRLHTVQPGEPKDTRKIARHARTWTREDLP